MLNKNDTLAYQTIYCLFQDLNKTIKHLGQVDRLSDDQKLLLEQAMIQVINDDVFNHVLWESLIIDGDELSVVMNDPDKDGLMLLLVIWRSQAQSCVHNHRTWASFGVIKGMEKSIAWQDYADNGGSAPAPHCQLQPTGSSRMEPGDIVFLEKEAIHQVFNHSPPNQYAVSLHCYGRDLRQTDRLVFNATKQTSAKHPNDEFIAFKDFVHQICC